MASMWSGYNKPGHIASRSRPWGWPGFDFRPLLHGSMLKKQDDIALAIDGTINEVEAGKIALCLRHMDK